MPASDHPAYAEERERLAYTLDQVAQSQVATLQKKNQLDKEITRLNRAATSENSQDYIDLIVNMNIRDGIVLRLRNLETAKAKPYFARIDFLEDDASEAEKLYIGKMSLSRDEDQRLVIVDWRAPVANLYYEGRLGRTSYQCPAGAIGGELALKRQFSIAEGVLREILDIDITTNDEFLQVSLGASADSRLKEIVSTIQAEQNRIIRAEMHRPLLVQGVAGSGKTTIALHRIAYLIYNYGESFQPESFMIVAPSRLFLNYISEVLPELGVERVKQTTFEDLAMEIIGARFEIRDTNEKLALFLHGGGTAAEDEHHCLLREAAAFKSSLAFKDLLERFVAEIERTLLPGEDLRLDGWVFLSAQEIHDRYYRDFKDWPAFKRVELLKKDFTARVNARMEEFVNRLQEDCNTYVTQIKAAMAESDVRRRFIIEAIERKEEKVRALQAFAKDGLRNLFGKMPRRTVLDYYREFLARHFRDLAAGRLREELAGFVQAHSLANLDAGAVEIEDIAPLLYLRYRLFGLDEKIRLKHLVIDEAQDFSVFQLYALKKLIKDASFTILGDLAQGIHSYRGIRDWEEIRREVFADEAEMLTLERSYRTTVEIMTAANRVLARLADPKLAMAVPVIRHGEPVRVVRVEDPAAAARDIEGRIREALNHGYKTAAVIGKTAAECETWRDLLEQHGIMAQVVTGKEAEYRGGVVIVPSYLAKGLEFDVVMIADAGRDKYRANELDVKLLYVAMTRALHRLYVYHRGELTPLLAEAR
ncbi:MAG: RNA polymerase recycling motor HelD [Bacteroidota bacterium]